MVLQGGMKMRRISLHVVVLYFFLHPICRGSEPLDQWTWRNLLPQGNDLAAVAYGKGLLVAVGANGTILTSVDGAAWQERNSETTNDLLGVAYGNGGFVATGVRGTILNSTDGITWNPCASVTDKDLLGVAFGNGQFVAVGGIHGMSSVIVTSGDGVAWSSRASGTYNMIRMD